MTGSTGIELILDVEIGEEVVGEERPGNVDVEDFVVSLLEVGLDCVVKLEEEDNEDVIVELEE